LRNASKAAAEDADAKLKKQVAELDDDFIVQAFKRLDSWRQARAFEMWRAIAKSRRLKRQLPLGKISKAPSFSSRLELLAQQKPRIEARGSFRKFKRSDGGEDSSRESSAIRDSSVARRESSAFPADNVKPPETAAGGANPSHIDSAYGSSHSIADSMTLLSVRSSDGGGLDVVQQLYQAAASEEEKRLSRLSKRASRKSNHLIGRLLQKLF